MIDSGLVLCGRQTGGRGVFMYVFRRVDGRPGESLRLFVQVSKPELLYERTCASDETGATV